MLEFSDFAFIQSVLSINPFCIRIYWSMMSWHSSSLSLTLIKTLCWIFRLMNIQQPWFHIKTKCMPLLASASFLTKLTTLAVCWSFIWLMDNYAYGFQSKYSWHSWLEWKTRKIWNAVLLTSQSFSYCISQVVLKCKPCHLKS